MVVHGYSQHVKLLICGVKTIKIYRIRALYRVEVYWRKSSSTSRSTEAAFYVVIKVNSPGKFCIK